jgi:molybdenum cofactor biosynthesis protein A
MSRIAALRLALSSQNARLASFLGPAPSGAPLPLLAVPLAPPSPTLPPPRELSPALIDSFGRRHTYLRVSLTERCNLRCTYCMPHAGVPLTPAPQLLQPGETLALAQHFVSLGVTKIRLTGGEPTVRPDLLPLVRALGGLRAEGLQALALTSNGVALGQGTLLEGLWGAGLDALNLSIDTLDPQSFERISRRPAAAWHAVWRALHRAVELGWGGTPGRPLKVNAVLRRGVNDHEAAAMARALTKDLPLTLRFIEFMPFAGIEWAEGWEAGGGGSGVVPTSQALAGLQGALPGLHRVPVAAGAPASGVEGSALWRGGQDWAGSIGFISTVTSAFCGTCSRLRLTADGSLRVCLHGEEEVSLRDALRHSSGGGGSLTEAIARGVQGKHAALGGRRLGSRGALEEGRAMVRIGG